MVSKSTIRNKESEIRTAISNFPDSSELTTYCTEVSEAITSLEGVWETEGSTKRIAKLKEYAESIQTEITNITEYINWIKTEIKVSETPIYTGTDWKWF